MMSISFTKGSDMTTHALRIARQSSEKLVTAGQTVFLGALLFGVIVMAFLWPLLAQVVVWGTILFFTVFVGLKLVLWYASTKYEFTPFTLPNIDDPSLPTYTVLIPLFKEVSVLPRLLTGLNNLSYPKDKLQVILLVEDETVDPAMHHALREYNLRLNASFANVVTIPDVAPRGKQKALNVGLSHAEGDFVVIYDAEDIPEPHQLLKAVGTFHASTDEVACLQARLFFDNETSSWVSRLLWVEYVIHFEWILKGLAQLGLIPPLGGTSNHFRITALRNIAFNINQLPPGAEGIGAWDPWNVTEDADLAGALSLFGYKIQMLDSVTKEIATKTVGVLIPQRSRWLKGYMQTGLVYTRNITSTIHRLGLVRWFFYVLFLFGTPLSILLSTLSWILTIAYFVTRSESIEQLFPGPLLYLGVILLVFGNFMLFIQHVIAAHKREGYTTVKWLLLLPVWQQLATISLVVATSELLQPSKRSLWRKTAHEHDLGHVTIPQSETEVSSFENADTVVIPIVRAAPVYQGQQTLENDAV